MERNHLLMLLKLGKNYRSFTSRNYQAYAISYAVRDWLGLADFLYPIKIFEKTVKKNDRGLSPSASWHPSDSPPEQPV